MRKLLLLLVLLLPVLLAAQKGGRAKSPQYEFVGGLWFDGNGFAERTFYTRAGTLSVTAPAHVDSVVDLSGKFVIPPFGEAHNHNVEGSRIDNVVDGYLNTGVFYVKNPNSLPRSTAEVRKKVNIPTSIDAVFAEGGLTGPGGHPTGLVKRNIERGIFTEADGEAAFYHSIADTADLAAKWGVLMAQKPDFIKTYLLYSEEYEKRKDDPEYFDWRGLDPEILVEIVRRAHAEGLRVSTHVETATDFHHAVAAGVDEINHLPGFRPDDERLKAGDFAAYEIASEDARLAGKLGIVVVTTVGALLEGLDKVPVLEDPEKIAGRYRDLVVRNLRLLMDNGVPIAIGSDRYGKTDDSEAMALQRLGVFTNIELLRMWTNITPATIFPDRKIGNLLEGFEASFLVLGGNPLEDFMNTRNIEMRVKQGVILE